MFETIFNWVLHGGMALFMLAAFIWAVYDLLKGPEEIPPSPPPVEKQAEFVHFTSKPHYAFKPVNDRDMVPIIFKRTRKEDADE